MLQPFLKSKNMKQLLFVFMYFSCCAMDHETITMHQEQSTTAPILNETEKIKNYSLDALNMEKFVTDIMPLDMQDSFVQEVDAKEWQKFAMMFDKDSNQWYKGTMLVVSKPEVLSIEEKRQLCIQILAKSLMYRCSTSKGHKMKKRESIQKTEKYQKASVGSIIAGGIVTVVTNLLQHFLTKK